MTNPVRVSRAALALAVLFSSCGLEGRDSQKSPIDHVAAVTTTSSAGAQATVDELTPAPPVDEVVAAPAETRKPTAGRGSTAAPVTSAAPATTASDVREPTPATSTDATAPLADRRKPLRTGTYRYTTSGFEQLDLGQNRHDYPKESTVAFVAEGCGVRSRWQPLPERRNETLTCIEANGSSLKELVSRREFSGQAKQTQHSCQPGTWASPPDDGEREWSGRCIEGSDELLLTGRVLPSEPISVDGQRLEARRLDISLELRGSSRGSGLQQLWLHPDDGLPLRVKSSLDLEVDTMFGPARYREVYELELTSLTPSG